MIPPWFQSSIYWKKSVIWRHHFLQCIFSMIVSFFNESAWSDRYVKDTVCISQHLLQPSIITRVLKSTFISGKPCGPALLKVPIYSKELVAINFFEKYCVKCLKALTEIPLKCFRRAIADISTFKGEFWSSYFLLIWHFHNNNCSYSLIIGNIFARVTFATVLFYQGIAVFENSYC